MVVQPDAVEAASFGGPGCVTDISPSCTEAIQEYVDVHATNLRETRSD
jgi:hypothetical protein